MNLLLEGLWCFPHAALKYFQTYDSSVFHWSEWNNWELELTDDCLWKKAARSGRKTSKYGIKYHSFVDGISLRFPPDMVCNVQDVWQFSFRSHQQHFKAVWVFWGSVSSVLSQQSAWFCHHDTICEGIYSVQISCYSWLKRNITGVHCYKNCNWQY